MRREWRTTVHRVAWNKRHRTDAYVRLGVIGTPESLAAIRRVEATLAATGLLSGPLEPDATWTTPTPGVGDLTLRPQTSAIVGQRSYGVLILETYGPFAPYLFWQEPGAGARWSRPMLAGPASPNAWSFEPALARAAKGLMVAFHIPPNVASSAGPPRSIPVDVDEVSATAMATAGPTARNGTSDSTPRAPTPTVMACRMASTSRRSTLRRRAKPQTRRRRSSVAHSSSCMH